MQAPTAPQVTALLQAWIKEDRVNFLVVALESTSSTLVDIVGAIERYQHTGLDSRDLSPATQAGLKTGLISNAGITTTPTLRTMLGHYELLPLLDVLIFSDEARLAKPSVVLFEDALKALGCESAETIFVGDSPAHDVVGARAAGMQAIVIGRKEIDGITPDGRIQDLGDLLDLIPILNTA